MTATSKVARASAVIALALATMWLFWPSTLGGGTTYINTFGTSMEPGFRTGDLAVLSRAGSYSVGEVVAYRSESLDTVVMHRIVAADAEGFVTQGDNNDWLDEDRPTQEEILGRLFVRIPQGGKALEAISSPSVLSLVGVASALVLAAGRRKRGGHRARALRRRLPALRTPSVSLSSVSLPSFSVPSFSVPSVQLPRVPRGSLTVLVRARSRQVALTAAAVALVAALGAGALVVVPGTETVEEPLTVTQQGRFSYAGTAERGTTYPDGTVATGDTVWTRLSTGLTVSYEDTVTGPDLAGLQGALRLDVTVQAADGWSTYLGSGPVVGFTDGVATASVDVDAARAAEVLARHYAEVGVSGSTATLTVTPTVALSGTVRGTAFEAGSPAGLDFALDPTALRLAGDPETVLRTLTPTSVPVTTVGPRSFDVLALSVPIGVARGAVLAVLALALLVAAVGTVLGRAGRGDAADEFLVRHADRIVPVNGLAAGGTVIDVSDADSLRRVAERFDTVVLHHAGPDEDVFAVRDVDATYRFVVPGGAERRGRPPVPSRERRPVPDEDLTAPLPQVGLRGLLA
ncbi:signal peptidase I [Blastococcus sp. BMG 814]|uniref:Signal peptidase I n=1 Tax=Blastococcus carthaginiensis TaxID=3050034 RepID=A0ABT9IHX9_9ACTN|nr:signal peptidase I [Blastococcus carthaginiensis]MDP5184719.1 signal peptidase I [Blastococcus carthaginiensis]